MPRTTLDIDPTVLGELRERARREGKSMGQMASELLAPALKEDGAAAAPFVWHRWRAGKPLVDLEDKEAVQRILDQQAGWYPYDR